MSGLVVAIVILVGGVIGASRLVRFLLKDDDAEAGRYKISPVAPVLIALGGLAMVVGTLLPLDQPSGPLSSIQSNTLVQHGGWVLIGVGVLAGIVGFTAYQRGTRSWGPTILGLLGVGIVAYMATNSNLRTVYPLGSNGLPDTSQTGTVVPLAIGPYVAGLGAVLVLIGGWILRNTAEDRVETTKVCPDCAETVQLAANVCKHCGYRFALTADHQPAATEGGDV
jgi:hypothetical protein